MLMACMEALCVTLHGVLGSQASAQRCCRSNLTVTRISELIRRLLRLRFLFSDSSLLTLERGNLSFETVDIILLRTLANRVGCMQPRRSTCGPDTSD